MRVRTFLRGLRGDRSINEVVRLTGLAKGEVSMFERGHSIPRGPQVEAMLPVYGDPSGWYPAGVQAVLYPDLRRCPGCGDELDPGASRRRVFHSEACRAAHRRSSTTAAGSA